MFGVKFGKYHSYEDFSLLLIKGGVQISTPDAKIEEVEVLGADGTHDLTEYFGEVKYHNRTLTFTFETTKRHQEFYDLVVEIANKLHGRKLNIVYEREPNFYYVGRAKVNEYKSIEKIGRLVIECTCEPYKLEYYETYNQNTLKGQEQTINLVNLKKSVTPTIIVEGADENGINVVYENQSITLSNGTWIIDEFVLKEGYNYFTIKGNGKITFVYRRGKL